VIVLIIWDMNELVGVIVMYDSGLFGINGLICDLGGCLMIVW